jgi:hypothetical protein
MDYLLLSARLLSMGLRSLPIGIHKTSISCTNMSSKCME